MRITRALLLIFVVALSRGVAQPPPTPDIQMPMFLEPLVMPAGDAATWLVTLSYRIDREFFVPIRNTDTALAGQYRRMGEILVELADSTGSSFDRQLDRVDIAENVVAPALQDRHWVQGAASFAVPPGSYRIFFEATDTESQRRQVNKEIVVRTPPRDPAGPGISGATFVELQDPAPPDTFLFDNLGGDFLFGKNRALLVGLRLSGDTSTTVDARWSFAVMDRNNEPGSPLAVDSLRRIPLVTRAQIVLSEAVEQVRGSLHADSTSTGTFAIVPVKTALLPLRNYTFRLDLTTAQGKHTTFTRPVRAVWPDMPFSLKNVDGALEALRFITSESQLDSLRSGTFEQRRDALEGFWQGRNRPGVTARNDVMTEYYRRVDFAIRNFGTLRIPDGSRSDRGKIFILYGPATRTERSLNPAGAHTETWFYDRAKKKFVFVDESKTGTYTLVATAPL
jgi:GWxTD domain-containing protein